MSRVKLTECPRDAMQGLHNFVPTATKAAYINLLLKVGFDVIDFGSFVSPKAIPQMRDTAQVLEQLNLDTTSSKLLAIVANYRGATEAAEYQQITYLGYPLSISETFQQRNTNTSINEAFNTVIQIHDLCGQRNKSLLVYLSMAFGNPYGDKWNNDMVLNWAEKLVSQGIKYIALADTVGVAAPGHIADLYPTLANNFKNVEIGLHLHSTPDSWYEKINTAYKSGCRWFDTTIKGYGGCPMAKDDLTGNIATEDVISYLQQQNINLGLDMEALAEALAYSAKVFI